MSWLRSRSASASRDVGRTGSTTSRSCRVVGPATRTTSTSRGRSTPSASSCPLMGAAMDGVISPATAIEIGRLGGVGVLQPRGPVDPLRGPGLAPGRDRRALEREGHPAHAGHLPEADRARAHRRAHPRDQGRRASSRAARSPRSAPTPSLPQILAAELDLLVIQGTVVSAEHVSKNQEPLNLKKIVRELPHPRDRRRMRQLPGGAAPDAHRRRRHPRRCRPGPRLHHPRRARHRRPAGHGDRRRPRRPHAPPRRDRRLRARDRRRRHGHRWRHRQGRRVRRRRRHARLPARRARPRRPVGATTGAWPPSTPPCPGAPGSRSASAAPSRRSWSVRPTRTTAASTSSAPSAPRWPPAATRRVKEFQKAEVMVAPALQTEGKNLQKSQGIGMGHR